MEILINDERKISDIQQEISRNYPFLKIEFFTVAHSKNQLSSPKSMISNDRLLGSIRLNHNAGSMRIDASRTVFELEEEFNKKFGLNAQIFRKSGALWIETSLTDKWTLELQNSEGYEMSKPLDKSFPFYNQNNDIIEE